MSASSHRSFSPASYWESSSSTSSAAAGPSAHVHAASSAPPPPLSPPTSAVAGRKRSHTSLVDAPDGSDPDDSDGDDHGVDSSEGGRREGRGGEAARSTRSRSRFAFARRTMMADDLADDPMIVDPPVHSAPSRRSLAPPPTRTTALPLPPLTAPVHALSSPSPRQGPAPLPSSSAGGLPLSMRPSSTYQPQQTQPTDRPPLVRNATAVPPPLEPALSRASPASSSSATGGGADVGPYPTHSRLALSQPTAFHVAASTAVPPRRPGSLDATGRLRGPSRGLNEAWLGISPPPVLAPTVSTGDTLAPPESEPTTASSSRSPSRSWTPLGSTTSLPSPPPPTTASPAYQQGLRPFRLRPAPSAPLQPVTTRPSSSSSARRTSLLAQLGSAAEEEEESHASFRGALEAGAGAGSASDGGWSTSVWRDGSGGEGARQRRRRRTEEPSLDDNEDEAAPATPPAFTAFRPLFLPNTLASRSPALPSSSPPPPPTQPPSAPTLSFLRPLQLPLSSSSSSPSSSTAGSNANLSVGDRRSSPAPPILTSAFGTTDDSDSGDDEEAEVSRLAPLSNPSRLSPHTRLPVLLSPSGLLPSRPASATVDGPSHPSGSSTPPLASFSSALAADWSSSAGGAVSHRSHGPAGGGSTMPVRRTPTLRPRTTDPGFSARFAAASSTSSGGEGTTWTPPFPLPPQSSSSSSFSPFAEPLRGSGAARPSLSSEQASTTTATASSPAGIHTHVEPPSGAGSRLAEYLSRHGERRRRLLPGLVGEADESSDRSAGERQGVDEWTGSLMDWFSARPNSTADLAEIQQSEDELAARRRRLHELRRTRSSVASTQPSTDTAGTRAREPSASLSRTLEALGTRADDGEAGSAPFRPSQQQQQPPLPSPLPGASIWDALLYPSPSSSIPHPSTTAAAFPPSPPPPLRPTTSRFAEPGGLPTSPRSREAMLHALLRQISADLASLSPPDRPGDEPTPASFLSATSSLRRPPGPSSSSFISTGPTGQQFQPPMPFGLSNLFRSGGLNSGTSGVGTDFLTEDEIDFSYEGLLELSARVPAVIRATPNWVIQGLKVASFRDEAQRVGCEVDERCAVCLEDYLPRDLTMTSPCGHFLHKGCLEEWLRTSHVCPLCRADVLPSASAGARTDVPPAFARAGPSSVVPMDAGGP